MRRSKLKYATVLTSLLFMSCNTQEDADKLNKVCLKKIEKGEYLNAYKFCEEACKKGVKLACMKQAYILDAHIKDGVERAIIIYSQLCADGEAEACYSLGNIYAKGRVKVPDGDKRAEEFFSKACSMGMQAACSQVYRSESPLMKTPPKETEIAVEEERIRGMVVAYHNAVAEERIRDALNFYVSYRKPQIKVSLLESIAKATEYYVVEKVEVLEMFGNTAKVYVKVRQKVTNSPEEQVWEGIWTVEKEDGVWKIVRTPGRKIR